MGLARSRVCGRPETSAWVASPVNRDERRPWDLDQAATPGEPNAGSGLWSVTFGVHQDFRVIEQRGENPDLTLGLRYVSSRVSHERKAVWARIDMPLNLRLEHEI